VTAVSFALGGADEVKKTSDEVCTSTLWESLVKLIYTDAVIVLTSVVSLNYIFWSCIEVLKNLSPSHFSIPSFQLYQRI
jgi:hypothetical protein